MRRVLALFLITATAIVVTPSIASSGLSGDELDVDLFTFSEPLRFQARFVEGLGCVEDADFEYEVRANGVLVTPISATQSDTDSDSFLFVLANNTPPGELEIELACDDGDGTSHATDAQDWSAIAVTKVVTGSASADATFTVNVACEDELQDEVESTEVPSDFDTDLQYTVAGGLHYVYLDSLMQCTITEPVNGGATSVSIVEPVVNVDDFDAFSVTVTNAFPEPVALQPNFTG